MIRVQPARLRSGPPVLLGAALLLAACTSGGDPGGSAPPTSPPPSAAATSATSGAPAPSAEPSNEVASAAPSRGGLSSDPLHTLTLRDVRNGEEFTLGQLAAEKPVLVEAMAIWCTNCRAQMHRVVEAHQRADFHSVGIDIDASELGADLKAYVQGQGFDWPFAMANPEIASLLRDRFGTGIVNPPLTPMFLLFPDGSIRQLEFGRFGGYSVDDLLAEIAAG